MFRNLILILCLLPVLSRAAVTVSVNGSNHTIPQTNEKGWGTNVTAWIQAISQYTLQPSGGTFTLTAEVDTGATYGFKVPYIKTASSTPSTVGVLRLAVGDSIGWKNNGGGGNLLLAVNGSDALTFNGTALPLATSASFQDSTLNIYDDGDSSKKIAFQASGISGSTTRTLTMPDANVNLGALTNSNIDAAAAIAYSKLNLTGGIVNNDVSNSAAIAYSKLNLGTSIVNADVNASAAIAVSKLAALTASRIVATDGSGFITHVDTATYPTLTELSYVKGVTSAIQTQLNALGGSLNIVTRDTTDTVDTGENVVLLTASGGAWTETLYDANGNTGKVLRLIKTGNDGTAVTIDGESSDTIGGVATIQLVKIGDYLEIISDGSNWQIIASKITTYTHYHTSNGYGSTNNKIQKYTTAAETVGTAFTVANDATNGLSVTINVPGTYCFHVGHSANADDFHGLTLNSAELTTALTSVTASTVLAMGSLGGANIVGQVSWCGSLKLNDVVRPHTNGTAASAAPARDHFWASRMN